MARRKPEISKPRNFCIRLTDEEKAALLARAGRMPLGTFIRSLILSEEVMAKRRKTKGTVVQDEAALARLLAVLGQTRLSSNLKQIAKAVHIGALHVTPETERDISDACGAVLGMRRDLLAALGVSAD